MLLRSIAATAILLTSASALHALEGKAVLDKFIASPALSKVTVTWDGIQEQSADSFTLMGVKVTDKNGVDRANIVNVTVRGLSETSGRVTYDSIAIQDVKGKGKGSDTENIAFATISTNAGSFPINIWEDGLTAEERRQRVSFGDFKVNGMALSNRGTDMTIDSVVLTNADIPLDYRYDPKKSESASSEPSAPLTFDQFSIAGLSGSNEGVKFSMDSLSMSNVNVPTSFDADFAQWMKVYSQVAINGISTSLGGAEVFALKSLSGTLSEPDTSGTYAQTSNMEGLLVNLKALPDPQAYAVAQQLGYEKIEGSMSASASYNPASGQAKLDSMLLKLVDMLDLSMSYAITGYTAEIAQKIQKAQMKMGADGDPMQAFAAIMPDLANVKFEELKINLTDRSLTGKLLDFQGQQMGTTGDQLAAGAPMMIGLGMGGLQMPKLTEMVTEAVGKFLKDKGTLSIEATPTAPVPIMNMIVAGQSDPKAIPDLINLKITAN